MTKACWQRSLKLLFLCLGLVFFQAAFSQSKYIAKYKRLADSLYQVYGVPAAVTLGVAIVESASGTSRNAKLLNNHFGIVGKNNLLKTKGIKTRYKQYPDVRASYLDFCRIMSKRKFYKNLKGNQDYKLWTEAISKSNYSEIPEEWRKRVNSTIKKNSLAPGY